MGRCSIIRRILSRELDLLTRGKWTDAFKAEVSVLTRAVVRLLSVRHSDVFNLDDPGAGKAVKSPQYNSIS